MTYLVLDLETGCKEVHKRKGNPWYNKIVAIGMKEQNKNASASLKPYNALGWRLASPPGIGVLVGHNIKYDLLYLWKAEFLQLWLRQGGQIFDTQLAEYIITGQQHKYAALRDIAVNKYGCKPREKKMEAYWEKGIDTKDIPKELVLEDVTNDVLDTEQVMLQQVQILKKEGQYQLTMEMMESLLATTEMEYNGIYINQKVMQENKEQLKVEIASVNRELESLTLRYWK